MNVYERIVMQIKQLVKNWTSIREFVLILAITLGSRLWVSLTRSGASLWAAFSSLGSNAYSTATIFVTNESVTRDLLWGGCMLLVGGFILRQRGWTLAQIGFKVTLIGSVTGLALFVAQYFAIAVISTWVCSYFEVNPMAVINTQFNTALPVTLGAVAIFGILSDIVLLGYVINYMEPRHGAIIAILFSACCRMAISMSQGPSVLIYTLPIGIMYAAVYWRWRQLWPIVMTHTLWNLMCSL